MDGESSSHIRSLGNDSNHSGKAYVRTQTFPEKLMEILAQEEEASSNSISWLPDDRIFKFYAEALLVGFQEVFQGAYM
eukprot:6091090-Ditylum_brightwellii.AAC.1